MLHLFRGQNFLSTLAAIALVAAIGCGGSGSSRDGGRDGGKADAPADHAVANNNDGGADRAPDLKMTCTDGGARAVAGATCGCNADCQSGFCVDGVCCDTACGDTCKRCDVAGSMGTCSFVPPGLPPRGASTCPKSNVATCGTDGTCDGQGACRKYVDGTVCLPGTCEGAAVTNVMTCTAGVCGPGEAKVCAPFSCNPGKQDCFDDCASNADCAPGIACTNGTCGLKMNGASCKKGDECASSFCADGVCCVSSCDGACVSCNQTGRTGTCWPIAAGVPDPHQVCKDSGAAKCGQTGACDGFGSCSKYGPETVCVPPSCAGTRVNTPGTCDGQGTCKPPGVNDCPPYACSGGACNTTCSSNADCAPGIACVNHSCGLFANGSKCGKAGDCASNFCVDGVCCNEACGGACRSCALASALGTCTPLAAGTADNRGVCKDQGAASCGTNSRCDGAGGCAKYATGTVCAGEKCASNVYTGPSTCNSTGQCVAPTSRACLPYACNGSKCFNACSASTNCVSPNVCTNSSCGKKPNGAPCSAAAECVSNVCAQGFCCATTCNASCKSCALTGTEGVCTNVPTGTVDPKAVCVDQGAASCGTNGRCAAGACQKYAAGTKCLDATCPSNTVNFTGQSTCDGAGKCVTPTPTSCFPFACGVAACNATCKADADCAPNATCLNGSCGLQPKGGPCSATSQCASGLVCSAQKVCCNAVCDGPCVSCTLSATPGTCSPIAAGAADPSGKCGVSDASSCGNDGKCTGAGACRKWPAGTSCAPPSCPAGMSTQTLGKTCDGAGSCSQGGGPHNCSPFVCNGTTACLVTCTTNGDCVSPNTCVGNTCGKKPPGAQCTSPDQCATGLFCTDGFCCTSSGCGACKSCDATGSCQNDDNQACVTNDMCHQSTGTCQGGACQSTAVSCDDNNPCTADSCNPQAGCVHTPVTNGTACNDHNACTQTDTCQGGTCTGGNPVTCAGATQCHGAQACDPATGTCGGQNFADGTPCNDGNACTVGDSCQGGACASGAQKTCTASDQCHTAGTCDPGSGQCSNPAKANGTGCDDGNACTQSDKCQSGSCVAGTPVTCGGADQCHNAGSCDPNSGQCSAAPNKPDGTGCNDGNACTQTDACQGGACVGSNAVACTPLDQCHDAGTCNPNSGNCSNPAKGDGTGCDDGNMCTDLDMCVAGLCVGTPHVCPIDGQLCDQGSGFCI